MHLPTLLLVAALAHNGPAPAPDDARDVPRLIKGLGSDDFMVREDATNRLDELGPPALPALRAAAGSDDPEVAARAKELVRRISRRAENARTLAATVVELTATDAPLDDVLADLSRQAGFAVVLGGPAAADVASHTVTVRTGQVPFWDAVRQVSAAGRLRVASAGGFLAPGAAPYNARPGKRTDGTPVRAATDLNRAVVLEARDGPPRPASVYGAVMVEALELPREAGSKAVAATVLQVWPEPKLAWRATGEAKSVMATGPGGEKLVPDLGPFAAPPVRPVKNADGAANPLPVGPNFTPNARQALVTLRTGATTVITLEGSVTGSVRSGVEPLARAALDPDKPSTAFGTLGTELTATVRTAEGKTLVQVGLIYDRARVAPVGGADELPGADGGAVVLGLQVTDADGRPLALGVKNQTCGLDATGQRIVRMIVLEVAPGRGAAGPAHVTFWGTYDKPVTVPFALAAVPLVGGPK